ncbi:unnamed protein product [Adineta ricciae]|uniref:Uncharacterized protein n=2 Tax=Adineta ricciae TaxID=249248 RepID=A0A814YDX7_ADIRI|nr:unnamed protein product [Adineta ricciae]
MNNSAGSLYFLLLPIIDRASTAAFASDTTNELMKTNSSSIMSTISRTSTRPTATANLSYNAVVPLSGQTWSCVNASGSTNNKGNTNGLYIKKSVTLNIPNGKNVTAYLESNAKLAISNADNIFVFVQTDGNVEISNGRDITAYLESNACLTISNGENIQAYLKSNATISVINCDNINIYYENNTNRTITNWNTRSETFSSSLVFIYSNISMNGC